MSDFISNIINRHNTSQNIVLPRSKNVFEIYHKYDSPSQPPFEANNESSSLHQSIADHNRIDSNSIIENKAGQPPKFTQSNRLIDRKISVPKDIVQTKPLIEKSTQTSDKSIVSNLNSEKQRNWTNPYQKKSESNVTEDNSKSNLKPNKEKKKELSEIQPIFFDAKKENSINSLPKVFLMKNHNKNQTRKDVSRDKKVSEAPTIKIHIGRIEIKAVKQESKKRKIAAKTSKSGMSLAQFLNKRESK